jgi:valyl-tRNA synthetase
MDKRFKPKEVEERLYQFWEDKKYFEAKVNKDKEPFCIILPPPNANADLHMGHAMFVYEDIMIRYQKIQGKEVLWLPGFDHAGIETQFVFEKHLKKKDKSRFDYDRTTLYQMIWDFVQENRPKMRNQLKKLGYGLDWSKEKFTIDEDIVKIVYETFKKLYDKGLVYRSEKLVNYCTSCGTSFADIEVNYKEQKDPLYYMKYGPFVLATVRPETKFGDTGIAVHPNDKRYQKWIGQELEVEGLQGKFKIKVVADEAVDPEFGTGAVKVTPAHDFNDFEIGKRHDLPMKQVIGFDGKLNKETGKYAGLRVNKARVQVVEDLRSKGLLDRVKENYTHRVATCYRCGRTLEPLPKEQWFISVRPLADRAKDLIEKEEIKVFPKRFKKQIIQILDNFVDWNVSRQIVWGIRIPAFYNKKSEEWIIEPDIDKQKKLLKDENIVQDEDTFDTWFSSAQWPFATLKTQKDKELYDYFYPTTVMETGYDILRAWVARMIMIGDFTTGEVPFANIVPHGMLRDKHGQKMSKSKGNVINPLEMVEKYGTDPLRAAFIFGTKEGNDTVLSEEKIVGMRNFANKIWNIGRFIYMNQSQNGAEVDKSNVSASTKTTLKKMMTEMQKIEKNYKKNMDKYKFSTALEEVYHFIWHSLADIYIEQLKDELRNGNIEVLESLKKVYLVCLVMVHPFMPFVTDAAWQVFKGEDSSILEME